LAVDWLEGWSEVLSLRGRGEKQRSDQRILGDSKFVQDVITGLDDLVKKKLRLSGPRIDITALAHQVCKKYKICLIAKTVMIVNVDLYTVS
jgi:hypothetical protein